MITTIPVRCPNCYRTNYFMATHIPLYFNSSEPWTNLCCGSCLEWFVIQINPEDARRLANYGSKYIQVGRPEQQFNEREEITENYIIDWEIDAEDTAMRDETHEVVYYLTPLLYDEVPELS